MIPTEIGVVQFVIGLLLLMFGSVPTMFLFVVYSGLMAGSAAIQLPAIGGSSIPPVQLALVFLVIRVLLPGAGQISRLADAMRSNLLFMLFAAYGVVGAFILPRIFENKINVTPMRVRALDRYESMDRFIYSTQPLTPTSQNLTTAIYLAGSALLALCAYVALTHEGAWRRFVKAAAIVTILHAVIGIVGVLVKDTGFNTVFEFFRNGGYAQLDHRYNGFIRMNGIAPEASAYGAFGFSWFVFTVECWMRGVMPRWTGPAALLMGGTLVFSTSSLAYLGLGGYAMLILLRSFVFPQSLQVSKVAIMFAVFIMLVSAVCAMIILQPTLARDLSDMIEHFTVDKQGSVSGRQRSFWAWIGYEAFIKSYGIGIGAGSFRSSSNVTAIMGSMGLIGIVSFLTYLVHVFKPLRRSTYVTADDPRMSVSAAAGWVCLTQMITGIVGSPTPDPGPTFAIFAGVALALRGWRGATVPARNTVGVNRIPRSADPVAAT